MARLKSNLVDFAVDEIIRKINTFEYISLDVVSEVALAEELNISRTPIREAIFKLIDTGILERTATKVVVKAITEYDIKELLEVREAIEVMSAKIIVKDGGLSADKIKSLEEINDALSKNIDYGNLEGNFNEDFNFHKLLVEYSGNSRLIDVCERVNIQSQRFRWITLLTPARYNNTKEEHQKIIQALLKNDLTETTQAIALHIDNTLENYQSVLKDNKWLKIMSELKNIQGSKKP